MTAHAKLSASGSKKWITCTPSANLESQFTDEGSSYAAEGTFMHALFEHLLLGYLERKQHVASMGMLDGYHQFYSEELKDAVLDAVDKAIERIVYARSVCKDPVILLEQRLDYSAWVPEGFGTGDMVIITDDYIEIADLKGGSGVAVSAYQNSQFRLYMLGAHATYGHLYDAKVMRGTVLQPRLDNYSSEELTVDELLAWANEVVVPAAMLAWEGKGEFVPGEHCSSGFCKARFTCAARAKANMEVAKQEFSFMDPALLSVDEIAKVLAKADQAQKWLTDVQTYALAQAEKGQTYPNFKLVEGRSNRKYKDQDAVAQALTAAGFPEAVIYERSLLGITAMEKTIGKKKFAELLTTLVEKPTGKPVLVAVADKREAINSTAAAVGDFSTTGT